MDIQNKTKEELIKELQELQREHDVLKASYEKDIEEFKQADQTVLRERILLRTIIESIPDAIYIKDLECRKLLANKTDCENNGCEKEEDIIGKSDFDFFPPEIARKFYEDDQRILKGESVINREEVLQKPNGDKLWLLTTKIPLYNEKGDVTGIVGIGYDITERKKAEEALRESDKTFRNIVQASPLGIHQYQLQEDDQLVFTGSNPAANSLLGIDHKQFIGKTIEQAFPPLQGTEVPDRYRRAARYGEPWYTEQIDYDHSRIKGAFEVHVFQISPGNVVAMFADITEKKLSQQRLQESETRFKALHNGSFGGILIHDKGLILDCNKGLSEITGYAIEELMGMDGLLLFTEESRHLVMSNILAGYEKPYEVIGLRKNGEEYPVRVQAKEIPYKGRFVRVAEFRDITEDKKREREIILAKEKALESDRLKSAFLANMSHEIRTPMNGIMGFAELLKEPQLTDEQQQKYIEIIEKSGVRMLNIINDIIDISRIEAGVMEVMLGESNINEQLEYIYTFFKPEVEAKGMQLLLTDLLPPERTTVVTDREKLFAVLTNLVKNAIKYSKKGFIEYGCSDKGSLLEFFVKDTGIGIPKDRQQAIFERFVQADIEDIEARQGAGLGLTITKAYVEMLGGEMWVESEVGKGSTFYFTIPYNTEHQGSDIKVPEEPGKEIEDQAKSLKILIVEDDELSAMLMSTYVQKVSKEILQTDSGLKAVAICKEHPDIDLILMDIKMPGMDGEEAARQIRKFNKDVVIIAQTAKALTGDRAHAMEAGFDDYITKPVKKAELLQCIEKIL